MTLSAAGSNDCAITFGFVDDGKNFAKAFASASEGFLTLEIMLSARS